MLNSLGIVFLQYWLQDNVDSSFGAHLTILKGVFCQPKPVVDVKGKETWISNLLNVVALDEQMVMFKMAMKSNSKPILQPPFSVNPLTKLWQSLGSNALLIHSFPEYFKLAKMAMTIVLGSVEDERAFSIVGFVKGKLRSKLGDHLPLSVQMFTHKFFSLKNFPYIEVVQIWKDNKHHYCINME